MERILLVEDDSAIYQPLTSFLRGEGLCRAAGLWSARGACAAGTEEFDLVLLDVGLRDGTAFPSARL